MRVLINIKTTCCCRREAAQMRGVLEGVQPELEPHHTYAQAHRVQALLVWTLRESVPAQGRLASPSRLATLRCR